MLQWILLLSYLTVNSVISHGFQGSATYLGYYPTGRSVVVRPGVSTSDECVRSCSRRRYCYGATYNSHTGNCRLHTNEYEACNEKTWTRDNSRRGLSIAYFLSPRCRSQTSLNTINGEAKNLDTGVCLGLGFRRFANTNTMGGVFQAGVTTEVECLVFCLLNNACWAVDFDRNTNLCFVHSTAINTTLQQSTTGVIQYVKICPGLFLNFNPFATQSTTSTTVSTTPTTAPTAIPVPTIGDNGICPSPFELLPNTTLGLATSGTVQPLTVNTTELCKQMCLAAGTAGCVAATFDRTTNMCFFHTTMDVAMLMRGTQSCCDFFRVINCDAMMMRQCWSQMTSNSVGTTLPLPNDNYIGDGTNTMQMMIPCTGMCFFTRTSTITAVGPPNTQQVVITRGCDTTAPFQATINCNLTSIMGPANTLGTVTTDSYTCSDSLCNIFTNTEAQNLLLYLPFDQTLEDHSSYMRNGYFWNWTMGGFTYDAFDKIKNKSALFDGMEMICTPFNNINLNANNPTLTVAAWVKREGTAPATMGIISKGTTNTKANSTELFKLISNFVAPDMHTYTFTINLDMEYQCTVATQFPINAWQFVTARVRLGGGPTGFIDMYVIPDPGTRPIALPVAPTMTCPLTAATTAVLNAKLNANQDPLCVGGTYVNEDFTPIEGSTNFFVGHIDEVRVFRETLTDIGTPLFIEPILSILNNIDGV